MRYPLTLALFCITAPVFAQTPAPAPTPAPASVQPEPPAQQVPEPQVPEPLLTQYAFDQAYTQWARTGTFFAYRAARPKASEEQLQKVWDFLWTAEHPDVAMDDVRAEFAQNRRAYPSHALLEVLTFDWEPTKLNARRYEAVLDAALKAVLESKTSRSLEIAYSLALGECRTMLDDPAKKAAAAKDFERAIASLSALVREGEAPLDIQRFLFKRLGDRIEAHLPLEHGDSLVAALSAEGVKNAWLCESLLGAWHVRAAWIERTDKVASRVTPEGWEGFEKHLKSAYTHYRRAYELHPEFPEAATSIITIAMGGHTPKGEDERYWFDRAVKPCFDWAQAYKSYIHALQPKWGGSEEAMLAFGRECAKSDRYDTDVPFQYISIAIDLAEKDREGAVWMREYDGLRATLQGYVTKGGASRAPYSKSRLIALGWRTGHWKDAAEALAQTKPDEVLPDLFEAIAGPGVTAAKVLADVRAHAGKGGAKLAEAEQLLATEKYTECLAAANDGLRLAGEDSPAVLAATKDLLIPALQRAEFMLGEPVNLRLEPGFPGYDLVSDGDRTRWVIDAPDALTGTKMSFISTRARFGRKYVVHADLVVPPATGPGRARAQVILDRRPPVGLDVYECGVGVYESKGEAHARTTGRVAVTELLEPKDGPRALKVSMWNEHWVVELDGKVIVKGAGTTNIRRHPLGDTVAFRVTEGCSIRNIRIQKLTTRPKDLTDAADQPDKPVDAEDLEHEQPVGAPEPFKPRF